MEREQNIKKKLNRKSLSLLPFLIPAVILALVFNYAPMIGLLMGFKEKLNLFVYSPLEAFFKADWTLAHYETLFSNEFFLKALGNTLLISGLKIVILFPLPILMAILITEIPMGKVSKVYQTIMYLPHFLSWAVVTGIFMKVFSSYGIVNEFLITLGIMDKSSPILWYQEPDKFLFLVLFTEGWKEIGWSTIVYISAILAIDQDMLEACKIDGANEFRKIVSLILPSIATTIATMFILRIAYMLDAGFAQIYTMHTVTTSNVWEILGTYIFRLGIKEGDYAFSAAVSFFNSVTGLGLVLIGNYFSKKFFGKGIY